MKKIYLLLIFIGLFTPWASAQRLSAQQQKEKPKLKLSVSVCGGLSFPFKNFIINFPDPAKITQLIYARTGESTDVFFKVSDIPNITHHVGFGLLCGYTYNSFNVQSYEHDDAMFYPNGLSNIPSSGYQMFRVLPGLILSYGKKLSFNFRIIGGVLLLKTPIMGYHGTISQFPFYTKDIESQNGANLAYNFGIGLRYLLSPKISLLLNADYFRSSPVVSNTDIKYSFEISEISATIGVGYTF